MLNRTLCLLLAALLCACSPGADRTAATAEKDAAGTAEVSKPKEEAPPVQAEELIWVYEARGNKQCEQGGGISLEDSSAKLTGNGVEVQESRCGVRTDRMYPSVCGGATGDILLHLIGRGSLDAALELGFDPADKIQYQNRACEGTGSSRKPRDRQL